ncbi:hypothetical protein HSBAA_PA_4010 (plasmid) [Vreelandella sulfidaeris]|uniref:Uncharacterized protein n=1 Tax=Vreelandella sulfidaeris TaxID=115553 RepID=A0A455UNC9_9GAMM|nr:hypothetical protein HSBAA_PA_4010 [Halomonas sulfidaeris]
MFTPNNGYVGLETQLDVSLTYTSFENGGQNVRRVEKAVVDWGDGSSPTTVTLAHPPTIRMATAIRRVPLHLMEVLSIPAGLRS